MLPSSNRVRDSASFLEEGLADLESDISKVYDAIARSAQVVSRQLPFLVGMTNTQNPFGERQAELDVFANQVFSKALLDTGRVGWVASEELDIPLDGYTQSNNSISVAMDPLDGSSNITTNNSLGSIFGIWRGRIPKSGREMVAAAFVTYGPELSLTLTISNRVDQYVEVREGEDSGKFALAYRAIKLPKNPEVFGFAGPRSEWISPVERFVRSLEDRRMHLRYCGTFIGDYNQIMRRGGIFSYPAHNARPAGKLRICYETAPVSYINELAGGSSSDGRSSILDISPLDFTTTSPFYVGNSDLVKELEKEISRG